MSNFTIPETTLSFPGGTTQSIGARGPTKSISDFGAYPLGQFETTGTISASNHILNVAIVAGFLPGMYVAIQGAGASHTYLSAKIISIDAPNFNLTLDTPAVFSVSGVVTRQDNTPAIQAAIDSFTNPGSGGVLWMPPGQYFCNNTIRMRRRGIQFRGETRDSCALDFPAGIPGIVIVSNYSPDPGAAAGDNSTLSDMTINGGNAPPWAPNLNLSGNYYYTVTPTGISSLLFTVTAISGLGQTGATEPTWPTTDGYTVIDNDITWTAVSANGITCYTKANIINIREYNFGGDGCWIYGDPSGSAHGHVDSNTDLWFSQNCSFYNNLGHGFHVQGGAANAGNAIANSCGNSGKYGFFDESDLGNLYTGCHTENNSAGSYKATGTNGPCVFTNCYAEGGQLALTTGAGHVFVGGEITFDSADSSMYIGRGFIRNGAIMTAGDGVARGKRLDIATQPGNMQFLDFVIDNGVNARDIVVQADGGGGWTAARDLLCWYNTDGACIAIPFGGAEMKDVGLAVGRGLQIGLLDTLNIRIYTDPAKLIDGSYWLRGWEQRSSNPAVGNSAYTTVCTRTGRAVDVWKPSHSYTAGDFVHTIANNTSATDAQIGSHGLYFTCVTTGTSGLSEPNWNDSAGNGVVTDNTAQWQYGDQYIPIWASTTPYTAGDVVKFSTWESGSVIARCVVSGTSGVSEPSITQFGPPVIDGDVTWVFDNDPLQSAAFDTVYGNSFSSNVKEIELTTTSPTVVVSHTPIINGNYIVYIYYRVTTATTNLTLTLTWNDVTGPQTQTIIAGATPTVIGSYPVAPFYFNSAPSAITLTATAGTANQVYFSASIVGMN
jgi:hypothetical protein